MNYLPFFSKFLFFPTHLCWICLKTAGISRTPWFWWWARCARKSGKTRIPWWTCASWSELLLLSVQQIPSKEVKREDLSWFPIMSFYKGNVAMQMVSGFSEKSGPIGMLTDTRVSWATNKFPTFKACVFLHNQQRCVAGWGGTKRSSRWTRFICKYEKFSVSPKFPRIF